MKPTSVLLFCHLIISGCVTKEYRKADFQSWDTLIRDVGSFSSPGAVDLNKDGIKDLVFGAGKVEFQYSDSAVIALNGRDGSLLWICGARDQVFGSPEFLDITVDGIPDVFIGGRSAEFMAIDGRKGEILWEYFPQGDSVDFTRFKLYNFYNPQLIRDVNGDGLPDILVSNGGYVKAGTFELDRPSGKLMLIGSADGKLIAEAYMPDGKETYMSVLVIDPFASNPKIIFGTGGERIQGYLFSATLNDILKGDLSGAIMLVDGDRKGFVAPPVLADINRDGIPDIIVNAVDSKIIAIDGLSLQPLWELHFPGTELYCSLGVGFFDDDSIPDFFTNLGVGAFPNLMQSVQVAIDGASGKVIRLDSLGTFHYGSSVVYDLDGDGFDEVLYHLNTSNGGIVRNNIQLFDFNNDTTYSFYEAWNGANLGSTPLLTDLNDDGRIELIALHENNPMDVFSLDYKTGLEIHLIDLDVSLDKPIYWGSYMGTDHSGIFKP